MHCRIPIKIDKTFWKENQFMYIAKVAVEVLSVKF